MKKERTFMKLYVYSIVVILAVTTQAITTTAQTCKGAITTPTSDFTIHGDGTVTHNSTSLTWQQCPEGQIYSSGGCIGTKVNFTWDQAQQRPAGVNAGTAGAQYGYTDWRLPDIDELKSIIEEGCSSPAINVTAFPSPLPSHFWSSSPGVSSSYALGVSFDGGNVFNSTNKSGSYHVLLVRDSGAEIFTTTTTSSSTTTTTIPDKGIFTLTPGWNLIGLGFNNAQPLDVAELGSVISVWKWTMVNGTKTWAVYVPGELDPGAYAISKGFGQFTTIKPDEGFWVNK